mmetsp:Transcript_8003/g.9176  ORF Transcript_8003/g.9176 Transcript_8003/m.9176 type:complete len:131 (+) Transcript_8003:181-573(+)
MEGDSSYALVTEFLQSNGWIILTLVILFVFGFNKFSNYQAWKQDSLAKAKKLELDLAREKARELQYKNYLKSVAAAGGEAPSITTAVAEKKKKTSSSSSGLNMSDYRSQRQSHQPTARRWGADRRRTQGG